MSGLDHARRCADHFRKIGLCPLPSRMDIKGPMLATYAEHYGPTPVPEHVYRDWRTSNIQVITGTRSPTGSRIVVVDCDGEGSEDVWRSMCDRNDDPLKGVWICRTGSGGLHFYFSLPPAADSCPGGILWGVWDTWGDNGKGRWLKHREVRILGDNALVIAPPSIHVETGEPYAFERGASPREFRLPAEAPAWLLAMPRLTTPRCTPDPPRPAAPKPLPRPGNHYRREQVLDAVGDHKLAEAKGWGLVTRSDTRNPNGWVACWVPGREDPRHSRPSGSFHFRDGTFQDRRDDAAISLFDLGVLLGRFSDWRECRDALGDKYIGTRQGRGDFKYEYIPKSSRSFFPTDARS